MCHFRQLHWNSRPPEKRYSPNSANTARSAVDATALGGLVTLPSSASSSWAAAWHQPKRWLAGRGAPENERQQFYRIKEMVDQAWEQKVGLSLTKQGLVYAAVPLIVMAMIVYPLMDCATGHHHCVFQHDAKGLVLALHPP